MDKNKEKGDTIVSDIMVAQQELNELKEQYGIQEEEKGLKKAISSFFDKREAQAQIPIKKKTYIWLAVLLGWLGGHRFYTKQYVTAVLYLLTCWTGFSLSMTLIDLMIVLPKKQDENGNIYLF
ncbi:MAG: TM2 domain-containing protein [Roseburia sp.]|nr:TM2 domain-containing protein [Roseburia sp.]